MTLAEFKPKHKYLICCDSDGCAIDTMDIKHIQCFGPCMVEEWNLDSFAEPILVRWGEINLYTMTRGINRFKGLVMALKEINETYTAIEDLDTLCEWAEHATELSERALEQEIRIKDSTSLKKALNWSRNVNKSINKLSNQDKMAFEGVKEALAFAHGKADIAIVSSANLDAVKEEWGDNELLQYVDVLCAQSDGSKKHIINELLKKGYEKSHILMCGDAPGDYDAAVANDVLFYPILVKNEAKSWSEFPEALERFLNQTYAGEYALEKSNNFKNNLEG